MNKNTVYRIWITNAIGYNNPKHKKLFELYSDIEEFFIKGEKEWRFCGIFTEKEITSLKNSKLEDAKQIISKSIQLGYTLIDFEDDQMILTHIVRHPMLLLLQ